MLSLTIKIEDEESQRQDRNKALKIVFQSLLISVIVTVLTIFGGIILTGISL